MASLFASIVMATLVVAALVRAIRVLASDNMPACRAGIAGSAALLRGRTLHWDTASAKSAPAFANLAYLPFMHLGGLFYPLPKSVQPLEFFSPAFYLDKLGLRIIGAPSLDQLATGAAGPSSHGRTVLYLVVLCASDASLHRAAIRRLARVGIKRGMTV